MFTGYSIRNSYATGMKMVSFALLGLAVAAAASPVAGEGFQRRDQEEASRAMRRGQILPLRAIEARVLPAMRGSQYLGVDFDPDAGIYTLKFLREGTVIWVQVDGRTGQIVGRTN